ncbi:hypothetical protein FRB99_006719, partial [Tulasnella sp. 403]
MRIYAILPFLLCVPNLHAKPIRPHSSTYFGTSTSFALTGSDSDYLTGTDSDIWSSSSSEEALEECPVIEKVYLPESALDKANWERSGERESGEIWLSETDRVSYLDSGGSGCVYKVLAEGDIVAAMKTPRSPLASIGDDEITALKRLQEFYGQGTVHSVDDIDDRQAVYMKYHDGVQLHNTRGFREKVSSTGKLIRDVGKSLEGCEAFINKALDDMVKTAMWYTSEYKMDHGDVAVRNTLYPRDYPSEGQIVFVDWGRVTLDVDDPEMV